MSIILKASYTLSAKWVSRIILHNNFTWAKKKKGRTSGILPICLFAGGGFERHGIEILPKQLVRKKQHQQTHQPGLTVFPA
jgi:hypothetical protein